MSCNHKLIGEGYYASVFRCISGDTGDTGDTGDKKVIKIADSDDILTSELQLMSRLPKNDFYVNVDEIYISKMSKEEIKSIFSIDFDNKGNLYDLYKKQKYLLKTTMPYIEGDSLSIINGFLPNKFRRETQKIINLELWSSILRSFIILYYEIKLLNKHGIIHGDLNEGNIIFNKSKNKMFIIDFNSLTFDKQIHTLVDTKDMKKIFSDILSAGLYNKKIKDFMVDTELIDEDIIKMLNNNVSRSNFNYSFITDSFVDDFYDSI